jgi:hypothetical protein
MKHVAKRQQTNQKSQILAGCSRLQQRTTKEPTTSQRAAEAELKLGAERTKNKLTNKRGTAESRPRAQQVISAESLEWHEARHGSSGNPFVRCGGAQQP